VVRNLEQALGEFQADIVVYNAGTDILEGDSLGLLSISEQVRLKTDVALASCLIYAQALLEYVIFIMWLRSVIKVLPSVKFAEDKVLTFLILREKC